MKFRKKPVVIEAVQWKQPGASYPTLWCRLGLHRWATKSTGKIPVAMCLECYEAEIVTLEGIVRVSSGDWIIKGVAGELYPCAPDIFAATYEPIESDGGAPREAP